MTEEPFHVSSWVELSGQETEGVYGNESVRMIHRLSNGGVVDSGLLVSLTIISTCLGGDDHPTCEDVGDAEVTRSGVRGRGERKWRRQ